MPAKPMTYQQIRPKLKMGDIVLFAGTGLFSAAIRWATDSEWTHVGIVVPMEFGGQSMVLLWESTALLKVKDYQTGMVDDGVQLTPLSERIKHARGHVAIRQLNNPLEPRQIETLARLREDWKHIKYERDIFELMRAAYDGPFGENCEDLSFFFCSELVAEAFQRLGLCPNDPASNEYVPAEFSKSSGQQAAWVAEHFGPDIPIVPEPGSERSRWSEADKIAYANLLSGTPKPAPKKRTKRSG